MVSSTIILTSILLSKADDDKAMVLGEDKLALLGANMMPPSIKVVMVPFYGDVLIAKRAFQVDCTAKVCGDFLPVER